MNTVAALPWLLWFDPERRARREERVRSVVAGQPRLEPRLLCAVCRQVITYPIQRLSANGSHEHACTNPHGITYHIGCFRDACGCVTVGESTTAYSWFAGYAWRIALCGGCREHLGWEFRADTDRFFGLILDRLVLEQPADNASAGG